MVNNNRFIRAREERRERESSAVALRRYLLFAIYAQVWQRTFERPHKKHCKQSHKTNAGNQKDQFYVTTFLQISRIIRKNWLRSTPHQSTKLGNRLKIITMQENSSTITSGKQAAGEL